LPRPYLLQIANARNRINAVVELWGTTTVPKLIHRNVGLAVAGHGAGLPPGSDAPALTGERTKQAGRNLMSAAEQAFLLTGELFVLSFVAVYAIWFADRLRRNVSGKA
jgi:hypothetical protein